MRAFATLLDDITPSLLTAVWLKLTKIRSTQVLAIDVDIASLMGAMPAGIALYTGHCTE